MGSTEMQVVPDQPRIVRLSIAPDPGHVRVVRMVAASLAQLYDVSDDCLDDVRLAVGEACNRAVKAHRDAQLREHVEIELCQRDGLQVSVGDRVALPASSGRQAEALVRRSMLRTPVVGGPDLSPGSRQEENAAETDNDELPVLPEAVALIRSLADSTSVTTGASGTTIVMHWRALP